MNSCQVSFFDESQRLAALSRLKDPLEELKKQIDFEKRVSRILPLFFLLAGEGARQAKGLNGGNQKSQYVGPATGNPCSAKINGAIKSTRSA